MELGPEVLVEGSAGLDAATAGASLGLVGRELVAAFANFSATGTLADMPLAAAEVAVL